MSHRGTMAAVVKFKCQLLFSIAYIILLLLFMCRVPSGHVSPHLVFYYTKLYLPFTIPAYLRPVTHFDRPIG